MISEYGTQKQDKNYSELRYLVLNVIASSFLLMENLYYLDGMMEKLEHSYHNLEDFYSLSMIHITMELLLLLELMMVKKLFLEVWKVK
jgi:hypothetical protein